MGSFSRRLCKEEDDEVAEPKEDSKIILLGALPKGNLFLQGHPISEAQQSKGPHRGQLWERRPQELCRMRRPAELVYGGFLTNLFWGFYPPQIALLLFPRR